MTAKVSVKKPSVSDTVGALGRDALWWSGIYSLSYPSTPVTSIDIPEVKNLSVKFHYNFFMKNESVSNDGQAIFIDNQMPNYEKKLLSSKRDFPRFIEIQFQPPTLCPSSNGLLSRSEYAGGGGGGSPSTSHDVLAERQRHLASIISIREHLKDVMYEEAISNGNFTAIHMHDTGIDQTFYDKATIERFSDPDLSDILTLDPEASRFYSESMFARSNNSSTLGEYIATMLSNIQPSGYQYAEKDERTKVAQEQLFGPRSVNINFSLNNLFINTVFRSSAEESSNAFSDEIHSLYSRTTDIQSAAINNSVPGRVSIEDYVVGIDPIQEIGILPPIASTHHGSHNEDSVLIGYIVDKKEVMSNGRIVRHPPIVIEDPDTLSFIDTSIKYGSSYQYRVRAVCLSQFEALKIGQGASEGVTVVRTLIASRGVSDAVVCVETTPPPPPDEINFFYDYEKDRLVFTWGFPVNPQQDIKKFQIFRRSRTDRGFELLAEYDFDDSVVKAEQSEFIDLRLKVEMPRGITFYVDDEFNKESSYIYAACSVDAHGFTSNYSEQFYVTFDIYKNKIIKNRISPEGAPKPYPNLYLDRDLFVDAVKVAQYDTMHVFLDPDSLAVVDDRGNDMYHLAPMGTEVPSYYMTILNCDLQESKIVDILLDDNIDDAAIIPSAAPGGNIKTLTLDRDTSTYGTGASRRGAGHPMQALKDILEGGDGAEGVLELFK
jgi:hypothetical protein